MSRSKSHANNSRSDDHNDESRNTSTPLSTGDVKVGMPPDSVQSIITQVDRNAPPSPVRQPPSFNNAPPPPPRRSFLQRIFCCGSKPQSSTNNGISLVAPNNNDRVGARKNSGGSNRSLPARIPEMEVSAKVNKGKKCLALDLDETLVHSSFQPVENASFVISVVIEGIVHCVYVIKRPGCDEFMARLAEHYELLIYTASLSKYADPLLDILDPKNLVSKRLFREHCVFYDGHYVKDLSLLNRDISQTIIVDNSPMSYIFHPENAIDCTSFFDDPNDVELWQIADFLISIKSAEDVRPFCRHWREWCRNNPSSVPTAANRRHL